MRKITHTLLIFIASFTVFSNAVGSELFAQQYFQAWTVSQSPDATENDLDTYLSFLTDDVGHQHLPYDPDSSRDSKNKLKMKQGMSFYLASHTKYNAKLTDVAVGHNVVVIKYFTESEGVHPQTGEAVKQAYDTVEVLELEGDKVSVIRKYSE